MSFLPRDFFERDVLTCSCELVGCELAWGECAGVIVETEAYGVTGDEACHTFFRPSTREFVEHHIPGTAYVYLNYGVHWMLNVLVKGGSQDGIILIRALEPIRGIPIMQQRRGQTNLHSLCSGPGKLTQALGITGTDHGVDLCGGRVGFKARRDRVEVITDVRIGINRSVHLPWRFVRKDCRFVSVRPKGVEEMPAKSEQKKKRVQ